MDLSRRRFVRQCAAGAGVISLSGVTYALGRPKKRPAPRYQGLFKSGELARREKALWQLHRDRQCCPRRCDQNRKPQEPRLCGGRDNPAGTVKVVSVGPHFGEEEPLVGSRGSGTIFFSNCNLLCNFCQNWQIAHRGDGQYMGFADLAERMLVLQDLGCHNINLVTPTHVVPHIVSALRIAIGDGLRLPLVYNTGGYDRVEVTRLLDGIVDIYMPDFKYQSAEHANTYSLGASDYPTQAAAAIAEMFRQVSILRLDSDGVAVQGMVLRHLVMPHNISGTDRFVCWVARELHPGTYVNIMGQYRPEFRAKDDDLINRRLTSGEWQRAVGWARTAGLTNLAR